MTINIKNLDLDYFDLVSLDQEVKEFYNDYKSKLRIDENEFVESFVRENSELVKEMRTGFLINQILIDAKNIINWLQTILKSKERKDRWYWKYIYNNYVCPTAKEINKYWKEIKAWNNREYITNDNHISDDDVERAREVKIEHLMSEQPLRKSFDRLYYKAPWRNEKQASLVVYCDTNSWFDFGEQIGGDGIDLVRKLYGSNFVEAIKQILNSY